MLPNDRGASARLTRGPECNALISGRLELRSLPFLLDEPAVERTRTTSTVDTTGKSLEVSLSGRQPRFKERREHILSLCARGARHLTCHGRSKRVLGIRPALYA
jgi:hypothetical protein